MDHQGKSCLLALQHRSDIDRPINNRTTCPCRRSCSNTGFDYSAQLSNNQSINQWLGQDLLQQFPIEEAGHRINTKEYELR
jgi:hypothetical protein